MPRQTPQGRSCLPEEVAGMAVFLASDAAAHMIGHNLVGKLALPFGTIPGLRRQ